MVKHAGAVADPGQASLRVDEHAHLVREVQVAGWRGPEVAANEVEAGLLHQRDLAHQHVAVGRRDQPDRPVGLKQDAADLCGLTVEQELAGLHREVPHPKAVDVLVTLAGIVHRHVDFV